MTKQVIVWFLFLHFICASNPLVASQCQKLTLDYSKTSEYLNSQLKMPITWKSGDLKVEGDPYLVIARNYLNGSLFKKDFEKVDSSIQTLTTQKMDLSTWRLIAVPEIHFVTRCHYPKREIIIGLLNKENEKPDNDTYLLNLRNRIVHEMSHSLFHEYMNINSESYKSYMADYDQLTQLIIEEMNVKSGFKNSTVENPMIFAMKSFEIEKSLKSKRKVFNAFHEYFADVYALSITGHTDFVDRDFKNLPAEIQPKDNYDVHHYLNKSRSLIWNKSFKIASLSEQQKMSLKLLPIIRDVLESLMSNFDQIDPEIMNDEEIITILNEKLIQAINSDL